jgi:O-antigen ligase
MGVGVTIAGAGALRSDLPWAAVGGALLAFALVLLVATDWLDGLVLVLLFVPFPPLLSNDALRIATVAPITAAVVFAWLVRRGVAGRPLDVGTLPVRSLALLMLSFAIATVFAASPATSARELLNLAVIFGFLVLVTDRLRERPHRIHDALTLLAAIAGTTGALAVLEMFGMIPGAFTAGQTAFNRAALGFGQPNGLGLFLAVSIPVVVWLAGHGRGASRTLGRIALPFALLGLFATFSRGSWLALLAATVILLFVGAGRFVGRVWILGALFIVLVDLATGGAIRERITSTTTDWAVGQRLLLQAVGIVMFLDHPITGVGPGGFAVQLDRYGAQLPALFDYLPTPHNAYIQMAAETGITGLVMWLSFLGAGLVVLLRATRQAVRARRPAEEVALWRALLWSFAVILLSALLIWPFSHGTGQAVVLLLAAAFALRPTAAPAPQHREAS